MKTAALGMCLAVAMACGGDKKSEDGQSATSAAQGGDTAAAAGEPTPPPSAAAVDAAAAAATAPPARVIGPLAASPVKLGLLMEYTFLGWTEDGRMVALDAKYDGASHGPSRALLGFRIVVDAYTRDVAEVFRHDNRMKFDPDDMPEYTDSWTEKDWRDRLSLQHAAWKAARPASEWKTWLAEHPLVKSEPSLASPDGAWKLEVVMTTTEPAKPTNWKLTTKDGRGFYYQWEQPKAGLIDAAMNEGGQSEAQIAKGMLIKEASFDVYLVRGKERHFNTVWALEYDIFAELEKHNENGDGQFHDPDLRGNMRAFWSPRGDRIFWAVYDATDKDQGLASFSFAAVGPHIVVVDRGAGPERAFAAVSAIEALGHPVTQIWRMSSEPGVKVQYRGDYADLAANIAKAVAPGTTAAKHPAEGNPTVLVSLGK